MFWCAKDCPEGRLGVMRTPVSCVSPEGVDTIAQAARPCQEPGAIIDKNSLWDELNIQEKELYVKKKKSQDMGCFLKTFWGDRDIEISQWDLG